MSLLMSQDDLARALRDAGVPSASKRLVQRWEAGTTGAPRPLYARALERVTGVPIEALGFELGVPMGRVSEDGQGGHDIKPATSAAAAPSDGGHRVQTAQGTARGSYAGIWLSRYEYFSSGRDQSFVGLHHVVVLQHGDRLTARSLRGSSDSPMTMDLSVDGNVVSGTWTEHTAAGGYYQGARYHGVIQMLVEPTGRRMTGKWVGFGKEFDVNTGPWELVFKNASTTKATIEQYDRPPVT